MTHASQASIAKSSSFYAGMRILPPPQRAAMYAVYAFCRAVDDVADEGGTREERKRELALWRHDVDALYRGQIADRVKELAAPVKDFGLKAADLHAIIDGMEMDAERDIIAPDWATLDLYCDRVASAVGRLSVRIFGLSEAPGLTLSHHLGRALQLTNIVRDIDEDAEIGRLYLPAEELDKAGITSRDPKDVAADQRLAQVCAPIMERAKGHFAAAQKVMAGEPRSVTRAPRLMGAGYRAILTAIEKRGFAPPRTRVKLGRLAVILILLKHGWW